MEPFIAEIRFFADPTTTGRQTQQTINFHTSCSAPVVISSQYG